MLRIHQCERLNKTLEVDAPDSRTVEHRCAATPTCWGLKAAHKGDKPLLAVKDECFRLRALIIWGRVRRARYPATVEADPITNGNGLASTLLLENALDQQNRPDRPSCKHTREKTLLVTRTPHRRPLKRRHHVAPVHACLDQLVDRNAPNCRASFCPQHASKGTPRVACTSRC